MKTRSFRLIYGKGITNCLPILFVLASFGLTERASFGQVFVNGDFETGDMTGWTITPGPNAHVRFQEVINYDIDSTDPGSPSFAAQFSMGQISFEQGVYRHIDVTQSLQLEAGNTYQFSVDFAAENYFFLDNADGGIYELIVDGQSIALHNTMNIFANSVEWGTLSGLFTPIQTGTYEVGGRISRRFPEPGASEVILGQYFDNFAVVVNPVPEPSSLALASCTLLYLVRRRNRHRTKSVC